MSCPCGCGGFVKLGRKYARKGCSGRDKLTWRSPEQRRLDGIAGGAAHAANCRDRRVAKYAALDRDAAIQAAWLDGYRAGHASHRRAEKRAADDGQPDQGVRSDA